MKTMKSRYKFPSWDYPILHDRVERGSSVERGRNGYDGFLGRVRRVGQRYS